MNKGDKYNVRGTDLTVKGVREESFLMVRKNDGTFKQVRGVTKRTPLPTVKVRTLALSFKEEIPGTKGECEMVKQVLIGKVEHCLEYLADLPTSLKIERQDNGVTTEWTF